MKSALQPVPQESSRPDSDPPIVFPANFVIQLPQTTQPPIPVHNGQTIQWQWCNNFSVCVTKGAFEPEVIQAEPDGPNNWKTSKLRVVGPKKSQSNCTYTSLPNGPAADTPPPPPPNVVIVDNSTLQGSGEK